MTSKDITIQLENGQMISCWLLDSLGTSCFFMLISPFGDVVFIGDLSLTVLYKWVTCSIFPGMEDAASGWAVPRVLSISDTGTLWYLEVILEQVGVLGMEEVYCSYKKKHGFGEPEGNAMTWMGP